MKRNINKILTIMTALLSMSMTMGVASESHFTPIVPGQHIMQPMTMGAASELRFTAIVTGSESMPQSMFSPAQQGIVLRGTPVRGHLQNVNNVIGRPILVVPTQQTMESSAADNLPTLTDDISVVPIQQTMESSAADTFSTLTDDTLGALTQQTIESSVADTLLTLPDAKYNCVVKCAGKTLECVGECIRGCVYLPCAAYQFIHNKDPGCVFCLNCSCIFIVTAVASPLIVFYLQGSVEAIGIAAGAGAGAGVVFGLGFSRTENRPVNRVLPEDT